MKRLWSDIITSIIMGEFLVRLLQRVEHICVTKSKGLGLRMLTVINSVISTVLGFRRKDQHATTHARRTLCAAVVDSSPSMRRRVTAARSVVCCRFHQIRRGGLYA